MAIWKSACVTFSPFIDPSELPVVFVSEDVPKKINGSAHAATTINNLGPVKKLWEGQHGLKLQWFYCP